MEIKEFSIKEYTDKMLYQIHRELYLHDAYCGQDSTVIEIPTMLYDQLLYLWDRNRIAVFNPVAKVLFGLPVEANRYLKPSQFRLGYTFILSLFTEPKKEDA